MYSLSRFLHPSPSLVLFAALAFAPVTARAQWTNIYTGRTFNNPISSSIDTILLHRMQRRMVERALARRGVRIPGEDGPAAAPGPAPEAKPAPKAPLTATDFKPSRRRVLLPQFAASVQGVTEEERKQLAQVFQAVLTAFEQEARKNNVAYAIAFAIGTSTQVLAGTELGDAESEQLAQDVNDILAAEPSFKKMDARKRQMLYEACIITGGLVMTMWQSAQDSDDEEAREGARQLARAVLEQFGAGTGPSQDAAEH